MCAIRITHEKVKESGREFGVFSEIFRVSQEHYDNQPRNGCKQWLITEKVSVL